MTTPTPSIPGVDRDALADAIVKQGLPLSEWGARRAANDALAYIAAHHECDCDREHADDEWVEVDMDPWDDLPDGTRIRQEWPRGAIGKARRFVHRDDLPDPDAAKVERMARAIFAYAIPNGRWEGWSEDVQEHYRKAARAALAASREEER